MNRRHLLMLAAVLVAAKTRPQALLAAFATEWTQLANNLQLVNNYIRQGEELRQKILMVAGHGEELGSTCRCKSSVQS